MIFQNILLNRYIAKLLQNTFLNIHQNVFQDTFQNTNNEENGKIGSGQAAPAFLVFPCKIYKIEKLCIYPTN